MATLTFSDEWLSSGSVDAGKSAYVMAREDLRRLGRKEWGSEVMAPVRALGVNEYGEKNGRLHVHAVFFGLPVVCQEVRARFVGKGGSVREVSRFEQVLGKAWPFGFVHVRFVDEARGCGYVLKYLSDTLERRARERGQWREQAEKLKAAGVSAPPFVSSHWFLPPRGRNGGLGRSFVGKVVAAVGSRPPVNGDVPPLVGAGGKPLVLSRYERDLVRKRLGLDSLQAKAVRAALNPEAVEMACRVREAGSVRALRLSGGFRDPDVAQAALVRVRVNRSLGRV
jgi:hypothetical protein